MTTHLGTVSDDSPIEEAALLTVKVTGASRQALVEAMEALALRVLDARECLLAVAF